MASTGQDQSDPFELVASKSAVFSESLPANVDVVIVGGGPAGTVLAARLSEHPGLQVLLLEAGETTGAEPDSQVPAQAFSLLTSAKAWPDVTEPQDELGGRSVYLAQGRGLGGGSSMNMMAWFRGHPHDYDGWQQLGATGWAWPDVAGVFDQIEAHEPGRGATSGADGPVAVTPPRDVSALPLTFLAGAAAAGLVVTQDFNGDVREGAGLFSSNIRSGRRDSTVATYLAPALERPNLHVRTGVQVQRVVVENRQARGVVVSRGSEAPVEVTASRAVILAAGAIRTPQLLMLSGIGPADHLSDLGITVEKQLPGVGQNLQDHPLIAPMWSVQDGSPLINTVTDADVRAYEIARRGPLATLSQAGAVFRSRDDLNAPDIQLTLTLLGMDDDGQMRTDPVVTTALSLLAPTSRGSVTLRSTDVTDQPIIDPRYLSGPGDRAALVAAMHRTAEMMDSGPLSDAIGAPIAPSGYDSEAVIDDWITGNTGTEWHPSGTARMGIDNAAVTDPQTMLVHGITNLFAADSSVMPNVTRGNTQAPVIMIAHRATDRIIKTIEQA